MWEIRRNPRLHGRMRPVTLYHGKGQLRRQDEAWRHDAPDDHLSLDLCGADRRADNRDQPEGHAPKTREDTRAHQRRADHVGLDGEGDRASCL